MKKGLPLARRTCFALAGLRAAVVAERSFRTELLAAIAAILVTIYVRPGWVWGALIAIAIALVLAAELLNTAIEHSLDALHPEHAPMIAIAKDCAAAAVLITSLLSVLLFIFMLLDVTGGVFTFWKI